MKRALFLLILVTAAQAQAQLNPNATNGVATTNAPAYSNGKAAPLSLDLIGNLRTAIYGTVPVTTTNDGVVLVSSVTPLAGAGTITTGTIDMLVYLTLTVEVNSDVASAAGGMLLESSVNAVTWLSEYSNTYTAGRVSHFVFSRRSRYLRFTYTNGAVAQATFQFAIVGQKATPQQNLVALNESLGNEDTGLLTRSVITGVTTGGGGGYVNVKVNPSGALTADVTQATSPWVVAQRATTTATAPTAGTLTAATATSVYAGAAGICQVAVQNRDAAIHMFCGQTNAVSLTVGLDVAPGGTYTTSFGYGGAVYCYPASATPAYSTQVTACY